VELTDFVLARIEEEEASWRALGQRDDGLVLSMEKGLQRCRDKRRVVNEYRKKQGRRLYEELQHFALVYYDHPEYDDDWRPASVPRWSS